MATASKLVLSEEKIREKSGFGHRDIGILQSLSIPGTYQEKITHLGNSLKNLTCLKCLDLSRNSLVCLEGIEYLTLLENLNLYYNNISSLTEVFRLHQLTVLKDVDLRLNPVAKNEPDYRLFLVYIIPRLRQLDNRLVRESERKASLSHFSMEETFESKQISSNSLKNKAERDRHSRTKYIDSLTKKCSVMDAEDEAVLNLIAKCELDLSKPPGITSASKKDCAVPEFHNLQGSRHLPSPKTLPNISEDNLRGYDRKKSSSKVSFLDDKLNEHPKLKCQDEIEGQHKHMSLSLFDFQPSESTGIEGPFNNPEQKKVTSAQKMLISLATSGITHKRKVLNRRLQSIQEENCQDLLERNNRLPSADESIFSQEMERKMKLERKNDRSFSNFDRSEPDRSEQPRTKNINASVKEVSKSHSTTQTMSKDMFEIPLLDTLLDLVDKYWNGRKSLQSNEKFICQARHVLSSVQISASSQENSSIMSEKINHLILENKALQNLAEQEQQYNIRISGLMLELNNTLKEMDTLKQQLSKSLEENNSLKSRLLNMEQGAKQEDSSALLTVQINELQNSNQELSSEIDNLKEHLEHYAKIQELTEMLQESHSSLICTNEHLLQELTQTRIRHKTEVEQLHWSYNELKKTMSQFPLSNSDLSSS
ncbi:centrosomal protein of 72 kDa isoform X1 [Phascolarctos cinereus]|uniref:Centrosomal protein of 72 kDa n=1 Tax=Phascolarctos cinereus TaxID=38626 RepID=A0A6P5K8Z3_PHACI|nr:centrosomal protein of 72 kDa isoform X1 [Phascolarctos cinereus]